MSIYIIIYKLIIVNYLIFQYVLFYILEKKCFQLFLFYKKYLFSMFYGNVERPTDYHEEKITHRYRSHNIPSLLIDNNLLFG